MFKKNPSESGEVDDYYKASILNDILEDKGSAEYGVFKSAQEAYENYIAAVTDGNSEAADQFKKEYVGMIVDTLENENVSAEVKRYLKDMHPTLAPDISGELLKRRLHSSEFKSILDDALSEYEFTDDIVSQGASSEIVAIYRQLGFDSAAAFVEALKQAKIYSSAEQAIRNEIMTRIKQGFGENGAYSYALAEIARDLSNDDLQAMDRIYKSASSYQDFYNRWMAYLDSLEDYSFTLTDDLKEEIEKVKSNADSITSTYESLVNGTLSSSDISSLFMEFPQLENTTADLTTAMQKLALDGIDEVIKKLEESNGPAGLIKSLKELRSETDKTFNNLRKVSAYNAFGASADGLDQIDAIYQDIKDGGTFDYSSVLNNSNFNEAFGNLDSYSKFIETVTNSPDDIKACQQAIDDLVTEYVFSTEALQQLTPETKKATQAFLEQKGVVNAADVVDGVLAYKQNEEEIIDLMYQIISATEEERGAIAESAQARLEELGIKDSDLLITQALAEAKAFEGLNTYDLINATYAERQAFLDEANAAGITNSYIAQLYMSKLNLGNIRLNTSSDIDQIIAIANAAGTSTSYVDALRKALNALNSAKSVDTSTVGGAAARAGAVAAANAQLGSILGQIRRTQLNANSFKAAVGSGLQFGGAKGSSGSGGSGSASDSANEFLEVLDWIEVRISRIERDIDNLDQTAEATWRRWTDRTKALTSEIHRVTDEIAVQQAGYARYRVLSNRLTIILSGMRRLLHVPTPSKT